MEKVHQNGVVDKEKITPRVIVHGGAFNVSDQYVQRYYEATQQAARLGYELLLKGGTALDVTEKVMNNMENNPVLNAGIGCIFTTAGTIEMDALIVEGHTQRVGAVANVSNVQNPVSLARHIMENTKHCMLVGQGAEEFALSSGFPCVTNPRELMTDESIRKTLRVAKGDWKNVPVMEDYVKQMTAAKDAKEMQAIFKHFVTNKHLIMDDGHDTIGAVVLDSYGNLACATSTGGRAGKMRGRVGDTPLFGCGGFANKVAGCVCTGHGEALLRVCGARQALYYVEQGKTVEEAAKQCVEDVVTLTASEGGFVMIDKNGNFAVSFNTPELTWATISSDGLHYGMYQGERKHQAEWNTTRVYN